MKSLAKNSLFNAFYQILNVVFPLISSMYVARTLMPEGIGRVAYAQNIASYFVTAAALGIPTVGLRAISGAREDRRKQNQIFSELTILNACSTLISLSFYFILIFCNPAFRAEAPLYLAAGLVVAFNMINIDWLYQGNEEFVYIVTRSIAVKLLSLLALFLFVKDQDDYVIYAVITSLAVCSNYLFNAARARKHVSLQFHDLNLKRHIQPILLFAGTLFFAAVYGKVDTTMLGVMVGRESVGYYSYAHKVLQVGVSFCAAVTSAFLPRLSYVYHKDKAQFYALISQGLRIAAFLSLPAAAGLYVLAPEAIRLLFGETFSPAAQTLRIFSVLIIVYSFGNLMCYQMMICTGNEKKHVIVLGCAAGINVILNSVLIPKWQHDGAAIASVMTELFINTLECVYFARLLNIRPDWKAIGLAVLSSLIMAACIHWAKGFMKDTLFSFVCCVIIGSAVYTAINLLFKNQLMTDAAALLRKKLSGRCRQ